MGDWLRLRSPTLGVVEDATAEARHDLETGVSSVEVLDAKCGFMIQPPDNCKWKCESKEHQKKQALIQPLDTQKFKFESNLWTPKSEKANPTSGHLQMQILIQPLDT